jgi:activating signal cointegrator complex subunit 3
VGAGWLLERCRALDSAVGASELACGCVDAAKRDDASMQQALMELLGFGDAALALMGELCANKAAVAAVDARDIRAIASASGPPPPARQGAVRSAPKKQSQRRQKQLRKQRREAEAKGIDEGADYLAALGFDEHYLAQERALGLPTQKKHAAFLDEAQREYRAERAGLPAGAEKLYGDGYEEVEIPPPRALPPPLEGELLKVDAALPAWARRCFKGTQTLNRLQSAVYPCAFSSRKNMLVCAPTGAGKTNVALLTVLELVKRVRASHEDDFLAHLANHKAVYVAPLKALAQEVVCKFSERLGSLGIVVRELTGDVQLTRREADAAHILVVTPEKWDVVTRKQGGGSGDAMGSLASRCRLLIVDEIHLLAEERGAVLECVVARTTRLVESTQSQIRLVGLSATLPNYEDVGQFLGCSDDSVFFFGPEYRPVPLKQTFVGVTATKNHERRMKLDELAYDVALSAVNRGHQVMVFVHSRKETLKTARNLRDRAARNDATFANTEGDPLKPFRSQLKSCRHRELAEVVESGFALHHAGMSRSDRGLSERLFAAGAVRVLCCTATLAWGVNLPAHAVICKGTDVYDPQRGGNVDLSMLDVLQIFGRAGRPQFDDFGEATLLTSSKALPDYLRKLARAAPIESCLVPRLADAVNAEVAAGTVASIKDADRWLDHTFLAVRLRRNPLAYGCSYDQAQEDPRMGRYRDTLLRAAARKLDEARMCRYDKRSGALAGTDVGRVGSHYYLRQKYQGVQRDVEAARLGCGYPRSGLWGPRVRAAEASQRRNGRARST